MKRVLIYGGTTEGRRLAEKLAEAGFLPWCWWQRNTGSR